LAPLSQQCFVATRWVHEAAGKGAVAPVDPLDGKRIPCLPRLVFPSR